jgi:hypothetical protein
MSDAVKVTTLTTDVVQNSERMSTATTTTILRPPCAKPRFIFRRISKSSSRDHSVLMAQPPHAAFPRYNKRAPNSTTRPLLQPPPEPHLCRPLTLCALVPVEARMRPICLRMSFLLVFDVYLSQSHNLLLKSYLLKPRGAAWEDGIIALEAGMYFVANLAVIVIPLYV